MNFLHLFRQQYEEWKKGLPDTEWISNLIPDVELDKFRKGLSATAEKIKGKANEIDIGSFHLATLLRRLIFLHLFLFRSCAGKDPWTVCLVPLMVREEAGQRYPGRGGREEATATGRARARKHEGQQRGL